MDNPLISVIVPIYKVEPYLRRCLDSIVNQTYTNLEIILVDDGSPDSCPAICDEYAAKDNRIVVIHKENGGLSDARNAGLDICKGEYISFVDSDDWVDEEYVNSFVEITKKEEDYDIIAANHFVCTREKIVPSCFSRDQKISHKKNILTAYCQLETIPICAWNKLYNTYFLKKNRLLFREKLLFEDQLYGLQCSTKANKVRLIPQVHYYYNVRQDSIMNSAKISMEKRIFSWSIILQESIKILNNNETPIQNKNSFILHKIEEALSTSIKSFSEFRYAYHKIKESLHEKPLHYWEITSKKLKKIFFFILQNIPSVIPEYLLYRHLKKRNK